LSIRSTPGKGTIVTVILPIEASGSVVDPRELDPSADVREVMR
jgi:hypothetical protein